MMRAVAIGSGIMAAAAVGVVAGVAGTVLFLARSTANRRAAAVPDPASSAGDYGPIVDEYRIAPAPSRTH